MRIRYIKSVTQDGSKPNANTLKERINPKTLIKGVNKIYPIQFSKCYQFSNVPNVPKNMCFVHYNFLQFH